MKDGSFRDVVHPSNSDMRDLLEKRIFEKYNEVLKSPELGARNYEHETTTITSA
jgi:DNA-binding cell septation regulator SpoVG